MGYENVYNLENGLQDWIKQLINNNISFIKYVCFKVSALREKV